MLKLKLSLDASSLQCSFARALQMAATVGVEAVDVDARGEIAPGRLTQTGLREVRKMLDDAHLRVAAVRFRTRRGYYVPEDLEARIEATRKAMQLAHSLGTPLVVNHLGRVPADTSPEWQLLIDVLRDLGAYGQRAGAMLVAETGSESGPDLARLVQALPQGALGVELNPGNLILGGYSPEEAVGALGQAIMHVQVSDAIGSSSYRGGRQVPLGEGNADIPALLGALEEHDYCGYLSIQSLSTLNALDDLSQAAGYLRRM